MAGQHLERDARRRIGEFTLKHTLSNQRFDNLPKFPCKYYYVEGTFTYEGLKIPEELEKLLGLQA